MRLSETHAIGFEGLLEMEKSKSASPVPLARLINMTFNADDCYVAADARNDCELGMMLFDCEMLSDEAAVLVEALNPVAPHGIELITLLGKQHREDNGGVFTARGYVEYASDSLNEVYIPGQRSYFERSGAPVVLEISKGFFNDPAYDNDRKVMLDLPVIGDAIWSAVGAAGAASVKECAYHCTDCLIPAARDVIDAAEDIDAVNDFARLLEQMQRRAYPAQYRAVFEASGCTSLEDAAQLLRDIDAYELKTEIIGSNHYAEELLKQQFSELYPRLRPCVNPYMLGDVLLEKNNAAITSYGLLRRKDGGPLFGLDRQAQESAIAMGVC